MVKKNQIYRLVSTKHYFRVMKLCSENQIVSLVSLKTKDLRFANQRILDNHFKLVANNYQPK